MVPASALLTHRTTVRTPFAGHTKAVHPPDRRVCGLQPFPGAFVVRSMTTNEPASRVIR